MRKKTFFISLSLGFVLFFSALCPQFCPSDLLGLDFMQDGKCSMSPHPFACIGAILSTLFILPGSGVIMYIIMTVVSLFPHIFNFPVKITPENAEVQYRLAVRLIRIIKTVILIMFAYISFMTVKTARGSAEGLGKVFLPVFLAATFGIIIYYFIQSLGNRRRL